MDEERGTLQAALNVRRRPGDCIAIVVGEITAGYKIGDFVIVRPYRDRDACTVEMPMGPKMIEAEQKKGSLLQCWLTIIGVPTDRVRIVLKSNEGV